MTFTTKPIGAPFVAGGVRIAGVSLNEPPAIG